MLLLLAMSGCVKVEMPYRPEQTRKQAQNYIWFMKHERIERYVTEYEKTGRVIKLWSKSLPYMSYIQRVFREHGLPGELGLLPMVESSFDPLAKNERASGLWQFTKATGQDFGLRVTSSEDERLNWQKSTIAAAKYLAKLGREFNGNWGLVLAAYNNGPRAVHDAIEYQGSSNYWNLTFREETMNYVPKFLAMIKIAREGS